MCLRNSPAFGDVAEVAVQGGAKVKIGSTMSTLSGSVASAASGVARAAVAGEWAIGTQQDTGVSGKRIPPPPRLTDVERGPSAAPPPPGPNGEHSTPRPGP